jgi:TonB family protein
MEVTDVLRDRMQEPGGLPWMAAASAIAHGAALATVILAPAGWLATAAREPRTVMTITLGGGSGGPANGGLTAIGGRAVQTEAPPEALKRPEPVRPPAAKTPAMTVPVPGRPAVRASSSAAVKQAPEGARGRTPTRGSEVASGSALVETLARGQGFGLSTSGGSGSGSRLDVADFCCPDYVVLMVEKIRANWKSQAEVPAEAIVRYTIQRDGTIVDPEIEKSSGYTALDISALRAVVTTRQLPPLPAPFPHSTLGVHLNFEYRR